MDSLILQKNARIETGPLSFQDMPIPKPEPDELLIKVKACGVCHTDLHIIEGEIPLHKTPIVPGHEIIGIVEEAGKGVKSFKKGDRVGIPWLYSTCGKCQFCRDGRENLCENARFTGYDVDGGYAEYIIGLEDFTYKIPAQFDASHAAPLMCAGVVGYRAYRLSEAKKGKRLGIFGFGASAHLIIQIAVNEGCEAYVFTRSPSHKKHAEKLGAVWIGNPGDEPPHKIDSSIIFAPNGTAVLNALEATHKGGTVASSCIYMDDIPELNYEKHHYHEKKLLSVSNSTRKDVTDFLKAAAMVRIKTEITAFPLKDANKALQMMKKSELNGAAVLTL
jgi:propanol-preferring alcohol dehydrogenase